MPLTGYMSLKGHKMGDVKGDCKQAGHVDWVQCYGADHRVEVPFDKASGERTGRRLHFPFIITKAVDRATPQLYQACTTGEVVDVILEYNRINDKGQEEVYFRITLSTAQVVNMRHTKPVTLLDSNKPFYDMEEVAFAYQMITWENVIAKTQASDNWQDQQHA